MVKRNAEGNLDYYKIDSKYKEEHYFTETINGQKLKSKIIYVTPALDSLSATMR
ncbi:MAG: hypothetical protein GDA51_06670 [Ekhidna sp.]|nr:hypothetical protein [Ekhidna sp.]